MASTYARCITPRPRSSDCSTASAIRVDYGEALVCILDMLLRLMAEHVAGVYVATLDAAREEAERDGYIELDDVMAAIDADEAEDARADEAARRTAS